MKKARVKLRSVSAYSSNKYVESTKEQKGNTCKV